MFVPQSYCEGYQHVTISKTLDWSAAIHTIYKNIGCENIPRKLLLQWKFEKLKAKVLGLGSQGDWEDLITEVNADAKKENPSQIEVIIDEGVRFNIQF
jgi:hypothetical protein